MAIELVYQEKDVEDLLEQDCMGYIGLDFVARQLRTAVGIVDVIAAHPEIENLKYVIEIKKGALDSSAYTQVLKYTNWLNSEESDGGKILYLPMLIGTHLTGDLPALCINFDVDEHYTVAFYNQVTYRLFSFDPKKGVCFAWCSTNQLEHQKLLVNDHNHLQQILCDKESAEMGEWEAKRALGKLLESQDGGEAKITLVKSEVSA